MPWTQRAAMSASMLPARAQAIEATAKSTTPYAKIRRRP